ncbi:MAG: DUF2760 domain-containing protein [Zoogloea sp.]|uniref:DUF2760 domain-containing protein n=1 Tax=Zoogloea sp. TaxID=49181 RepID=UPI002624FA48|nr:DUF2760 domain-containing protein [Zoogloea sp.]MDD3325707.1 DUF2760 domain-containing protein [Zoogloea sp.]
MTRPNPSLLSRLALAFSVLFQPALAARVRDLRDGVAEPAPQPAPAPVTVAAPTPAPAPAPAAPPPAPLREAPHESALQLLGLLQREARFIDFIEEDVKAYSDADIGGAARVVHEGCRKVLREHFSLAPLRSEPEGSRITLPEGFDAAAVRVTGNVVGKAPFSGTLSHRGWRATDTRLPRLAAGHDAAILAQAEVEL